MELKRARIVSAVGATEVELGAGRGELEPKDGALDSALLRGGVEEGVLGECQMRWNSS